MMIQSTAEALSQVLDQYYPANLWPDDPAYKASAEAQRLTRLLEDARRNMRTWKSFVHRVREEFPGCVLWDTTLLSHDPCYCLRVSLPDTEADKERVDAVVCLLSLLAPAYALYASHCLDTGPFSEAWTRYPPLPPGFHPHEARLAVLIESSFGFTRLPNDVLFAPIPHLAPRTGNVALGKARLMDLLFTLDRW